MHHTERQLYLIEIARKNRTTTKFVTPSPGHMLRFTQNYTLDENVPDLRFEVGGKLRTVEVGQSTV
jgi:hypothetical protein